MMRDLDILLSSVRNPASRRHMDEVVRAYQAGAFRAAIISCWVAVALDLVSKLREIADDGDSGAQVKVAELDAAINSNNRQKLQSFENGLLDLCRDDFELINGRDHAVLSRLAEDRNSCAHPAFVAPDDVFVPSAELARTHLAAAVDAVLQHPPTPGKRIIQRFKSEIESSAWPSSPEDLASYLRDRYFGPQRESAKRQLAKLIVKCCLTLPADTPHRDRLIVRYPDVAKALNEVAPTLLEETVTEVVRHKEETAGLSEEEIRGGIGALGDLPTFWNALPATSGPRVVTCVTTSLDSQLVSAGVLAVSPPDVGVGAQVAQLIQTRLADIEVSLLADALAQRASPSLVEQTVRRVETSDQWNTTNTLMPLVPALVTYLDSEHVIRLCEAAVLNYEIYQAHAADAEFTRLFDLTSNWPGVREGWIAVARFEHPHRTDNRSAFPTVRARVLEAWGQTVLD